MQLTMNLSARTWAAAAVLALSGSLAQAALVNGGFETGDLTGWTASGETSFIGVAAGIGNTGDYGAFFGPDPLGSISQTLSTTAGGLYRVAFWLALDDSAAPNQFSWSWAGVEQDLLVDATAFGFVRYSATVASTTGLSELSFSFANAQSFYRLDDVSVSAVPEPATAALTIMALLGMGALSARRKKTVR